MSESLLKVSKVKQIAKEQAEASFGAEALTELSAFVEGKVKEAAEIAKAEGKQIVKAHHLREALNKA
jgi:hypothetical protein